MNTRLKIYLKLLMLFSLFMLISIVANAQQVTLNSDNLKNEVKANLLGLAIGLPELLAVQKNGGNIIGFAPY